MLKLDRLVLIPVNNIVEQNRERKIYESGTKNTHILP
jgi:hypothetical protein